jgi:hypothetical protein
MYHPAAMRLGLGVLVVSCAAFFAACTDEDGSGDTGIEPPDAGAPPVWIVESNVPTQEDLFAVYGRAADDVWAVGWNGTILHYDGVSWLEESTTATVPLTDVHGRPNPEDETMPDGPLFAVGWGGTILKRDAFGAWSGEQLYGGTGLPTSTATQDLFGVYVGSDESAMAVGDNGRIIGWDGMRWELARFVVAGEISGRPISPLEVLKGVFSRNDGDRYWIAGSGGAAFRSNGGFASFEALDTRVSEPLRGVWGPPGGGPIYTVGLDSLILAFDGGQWRRVQAREGDVIPSAFLFDVDGRSNEDITVVGWRGTVIRYLGGRWFPEETAVDRDLRGVWVDQETGTAFAVGATGTILRRPPPPEPDAGVVD